MHFQFCSKLVLATLLVGFSLSASATPELAEAWQKKAGELKEQVQKTNQSSLDDTLSSELSRFGRTAGKLAKSGSADHPLPKDLACIFRGMEEETRVQLSAMSSAQDETQWASAKERLLLMLGDAEIVGKAAILELGGLTHEKVKTSSQPRSCISAEIPEDTPRP